MKCAVEAFDAARLTLSVRRSPSVDWDAYVDARPSSTIYLASGWTLIAREVFGHEAFFVEARDVRGVLCGVLPFVRQKSLVFGDFATSVPFFNYGGALGDREEVAQLMMEHARKFVSNLGCSYLEFRDVEQRQGEWLTRLDKVSMVLQLPQSVAALSKALGAKLRSQVKRSDREAVSVRVGGRELLDDFYDIFCRNMRDLGTPVYSKRFFKAILDRFPRNCTLLVVDRRGAPAAGAFLVISNQRAEIPWAACRADAKPLGFNMRLYWEVLVAVLERGCTVFDFGRSTIGSGTFAFKEQWGATPIQLRWHRWERHSARNEPFVPAAESTVMRIATSLWRRLPLRVANALGPLVSPHLPW
jgi:serine/alanine adding enzyme